MIKKIFLFALRQIQIWFRLLRLTSLKILSLVFRPFLRKREYWLLLERGFDAQDNAWHMFKFLREQHPEINSVYAIHKDSLDFQSNLSGYENNVIEYNSIWYYIVLYNCKVMISTHVHTYIYKTWSVVKGGVLDIKGKKVTLHHGICHNQNNLYKYPNLDVDLNFCGAKNEYELFKSVFGYPDSCLCYAGMARFDNLHNNQLKRQVLVMPTWRVRYTGMTKKEFEATDFFTAYKSILTDDILLKSLEDYDYNLIFYNHFEFQKFNSSFSSFCNGRVQLKYFGEQSVQHLLKESKLLVTDYSSVYYDFLYMRKPIVFFLLNQMVFRASQYGKDYDDPRDFGDVVESSEEVVTEIISHLKNDCILDKRFLDYSKSVFPLFDQHNRERIYQRIADLI